MNDKQLELALTLKHYSIEVESEKFKIVCPFHNDKNASMLIDMEHGTWYCFGCNLGGNAKDFIKLSEKCSDIQAYMLLSKIMLNKTGIDSSILYKTTTKKEHRRNKKRYLDISKDYYFNLSKVNWKNAKKYYASDEKKYLLKRGFTSDILNECGCKVTFNTNYPIIFPMYDMGEFRGYVCRTMSKKIEEKRKYLYNKGFSRKNTLVGRYNHKTVVIVEGYMDYLKARMFGIKYVVALLGWKMSKEQIQKLKDAGVKTIISALDNDKCGKQGTLYVQKYFNVIQFPYEEGIKDLGEMNQIQFNKAYKKLMKKIGG